MQSVFSFDGEAMKLTIGNLLENGVGTRFHLADRLIVEDNHFASDCDRCTCER